MATKSKKDPRVDKSIKDAPAFAKPIFNHIRKLIRATCPGAVETIKWGSPWYTSNDKVLCGMVSFKAHCAWLFNKGSMIVTPQGDPAKTDMGQLRKLTQLSDLPSDRVLKAYLKQAVKLNEPGAKLVKRKIQKKPPVKTPADLLQALRMNPKAKANYEKFISTNQRHYVDWINDAKTEETREKRLEKAVECIAAGKPRHWK